MYLRCEGLWELSWRMVTWGKATTFSLWNKNSFPCNKAGFKIFRQESGIVSELRQSCWLLKAPITSEISTIGLPQFYNLLDPCGVALQPIKPGSRFSQRLKQWFHWARQLWPQAFLTLQIRLVCYGQPGVVRVACSLCTAILMSPGIRLSTLLFSEREPRYKLHPVYDPVISSKLK